MEDVIASIRDALAPDASHDARAAGAAACRTVLGALDRDREPSLDPSPADPDAPRSAPDAVAGARALIAKLARIPAGHRLDLAIDVALGKLRGVLPANAPPIEVRSLRFPLVSLGAHVSPIAACASCGERDGHGWWCKAPSGGTP